MTKKIELLRWQLLSHCLKHREEDGRCIRIQGKHISLFRSREGVTANLRLAAASCVKARLLVPFGDEKWEWPDFILSVSGEAIANGLQPEWKSTPPKLDDRDLSLLLELSEKWATPMEMGGGNGSHHSNSLRKLCENGLAESSNRQYPVVPSIFSKGRGSQRYRITARGKARRKKVTK